MMLPRRLQTWQQGYTDVAPVTHGKNIDVGGGAARGILHVGWGLCGPLFVTCISRHKVCTKQSEWNKQLAQSSFVVSYCTGCPSHTEKNWSSELLRRNIPSAFASHQSEEVWQTLQAHKRLTAVTRPRCSFDQLVLSLGINTWTFAACVSCAPKQLVRSSIK